jgi:hypothetical protein
VLFPFINNLTKLTTSSSLIYQPFHPIPLEKNQFKVLLIFILVLVARIPLGIGNHDAELVHIRRELLRPIKLPLDIMDHQIEVVLVACRDDAGLGRQCVLEVEPQRASGRVARLSREPCEESRVGGAGVQGGLVVAAAEPAMAVDLDADDDLCSGRGAGVGSGAGAARGSRVMGWKLFWLASWIRIRWSMGIHPVIVGIGDVSLRGFDVGSWYSAGFRF